MSFSETEKFYQDSIASFKSLRSKYERHQASDIGGRSFILVSAVDAEMKSSNGTEPGLLDNLLQTSYGRHQNSLPSHKPGQVHEFLPIFYTLLDLDRGHLIDRFIHHTPPLQLPIEMIVLERMFPADRRDPLTEFHFGQLAAQFYNQQWHWCALQFRYRTGSKIEHHEHIIPITARSRIEPARDSVQNTDRKTTLWVVEIPVECVDDDLREEFREVSEADFDRQSGSVGEINKSYNLVIKQFADDESFGQEWRIHNSIRERNGIVKCFGWYEHREKDAKTGTIRTYYNLVLERGTQDLYSAFQKENPPIAQVEIDVFWSSLFDVAAALASIQKIDEHGDICTRYVWHGDIKPENILDVQGRFKLADPGEACVVPVPKLEHAPHVDQRVLKTKVPGGTRSFAAPEKNTYATAPTRADPLVTQGIDIWSLGCVFSVAATYVVAGKEGVKQYRLLRRTALWKIGLDGDPFHDTKSVLPEVTEWHHYLRTCIRRQDYYTARVLDIVDNSMLIIPGEKRISGSDLNSTLVDIKEHAMRQCRDQPQPPKDILKFLEGVMESTGDEHKPTLEDIPRTISKSGADMFEEALLYPSLRSVGRPLPGHAGPLPTVPGKNREIAIPPYSMTPYGGTNLPLRPEAGLSRASLPKITTVLSSEASTPVNPPITFWEVEAQLEQQSKTSSTGFVKTLGSLRKMISPKPNLMKSRDDQLAKHFVNRDLVYLVDNASTMAKFWKHATYLLRVLVWRSLELDEDGMELIFTNGELDIGLKPKGKGHKQKPESFVKKMDDTKPDPDARVETNMKASLGSILDTHMKKNSHGATLKKGLTVLVLTDGLWAANNDSDVDEYLANFIMTNRATRGWDGNSPDDQSRRRPIGIQFIRFGHHPEAIRRLQRLDDELKERVELLDKEIPDMVDTENADGDFYKMFLGSMLEDMDNKLVQGGVGTDALSMHTGTPVSVITLESSTPGSRRASRLSYPLQSRPSFGHRNDPSIYTP